ncbi:MAG: hypothetical protein J1F03_05845 [Oscillospiraceae bacterium]|nr:hypothetical protein [Oscillospiraceae bacterium]
MPNKDYDIDNILKEVDDSRFDASKSSYNGSVTDIIGDNDLDKLLRAGSQKKPNASAGKQKPDLSVTQLINQYSDKRENTAAARQFSEAETDARRSKEIAEAIESERRKRLFDDTDSQPIINTTFNTDSITLSSGINDGTAEDESVRIYADKNTDNNTGSFSFGGSYDDTAEGDYTENYSAEENDDIIFHTRSDLVTTDTMKMRKQQRIDEINQALLKADSEAQSPEEMLELLNPAAKREKVADMLKSDDDTTDTLAIAGNDFKNIGKEEHVIEYKPTSRKKEVVDETAVVSGKQINKKDMLIGESISEALDKKIAGEYEQKAYTIKIPENMENPVGDMKTEKYDLSDSAGKNDEEKNEDERLEKIRRANELAHKRKRKIANFILENPDEEEDEYKPENNFEDEDDEDEPIDLDDETVIRDRLSRSATGLLWRLVITGVLFIATLIIGILNTANIQNMGAIGGVINLRSSTENYLYCMLTIGILSFATCSSVIANGFSRMFKLRPDGDTLCAFAHSAAIASIVPYLLRIEYIQRSMSHVYLMVSLGILCFNTLSKLIAVQTAKKNFEFVSADGAKYFADICNKSSAERLAKGAVSGVPITASMRKTEMLKDFIISTYCEDASDRVSGKTAIATVISAVIGAVIAFFTNGDELFLNNLSWAFTVLSAICCLGAALSCSMTVTIPLLFASIKGGKNKFAILGYEAVEKFSETNSVLVEASALFPPQTVVIDNICGYDKPSNRGDGKVNIDEAIILGASLAYATGSILSDSLFNMLDYKKELLKTVSGVVYENNLGVMGWIDRRRVLLGTREHMQAHDISVPSIKKESAANPKNDSVIYLAVGGEVCLLFFVSVTADEQILKKVNQLISDDISIIVKTVDGMITNSFMTKTFGVEENSIKVIPFEYHESFNECTRFVSSGNAGLSLGGTFASLADGVSIAKKLRTKISIGSIVQICTAGIGILLAIIFMLFKLYDMFNGLWILIYGLISAVITVGIPFFKRL